MVLFFRAAGSSSEIYEFVHRLALQNTAARKIFSGLKGEKRKNVLTLSVDAFLNLQFSVENFRSEWPTTLFSIISPGGRKIFTAGNGPQTVGRCILFLKQT